MVFIEGTWCCADDLPHVYTQPGSTSCHIEHLEVDIIRPSLAIDGAEVMGAGTHHCHTVHLYLEQHIITSLLALQGRPVPLRDRAGWGSAAASVAPR